MTKLDLGLVLFDCDFPTVDSGGMNSDGVPRMTVIASPSVNQDQLWRLFDLIPGLDFCDLRKDRKSGQVQPLTYAGSRII